MFYADGILSVVPDTIPDNGTSLTLTYEEGATTNTNIAGQPDGAGLFSGTIPGAPLLPGSVSLEWIIGRLGSTSSQRYGGGTVNASFNLTRKAYDDGGGGWGGLTGTLDYQTGAFTIKVTENYNYSHTIVSTNQWHCTSTTTVTQAVESFSGSNIICRAQSNSLNHVAHNETLDSPDMSVDLLPHVEDAILPGSVVFAWGGATYFDRDGTLYKDISTQTNAGTAVGTLDYTGGLATFTSYPPSMTSTANGTLTIDAMATTRAGMEIEKIAFRAPGAPLRPGSLQVWANRADTGERISAQADFNGTISSDEMDGKVSSENGWCTIAFAETNGNPIYVIPQSVTYNTIVLTSIPMDSRLIGLDPVRLPADGRVPIYREGDVVVLGHTADTDIGTPTAGQVVTLSRDHQVSMTVVGSNDVPIKPDQVVINKEAGSLLFADPLVLNDANDNPLVPPLKVIDRIEQMSVVSDVQINGDLSIIAPLAWDFPVGTTVSSAVVYGDLQARTKHIFTQRTWSSSSPNWRPVGQGAATTAQYNLVNYPIAINNKGAIEGKWALVFTGTTAFQIVEEKLGIIGAGSTASNAAPVNPETNTPYWTIDKDGWGTGWASGNVLRFDTEGALAPLWLVRTTLAGQGTRQDDQFTLQVRGDAD